MAERSVRGEAAAPPHEGASAHLQRELRRLDKRIEEGDPFWPAQLAVALAIALHLALSDKLVIGPIWLIPAAEGVLLVALIVIAPSRASRVRSMHMRYLMLTILALVTLTYLVSLVLLVQHLVSGGQAGGRQLIGSGVVLWATNVLLFGVWYWELDRGGPIARFRNPKAWPDFQFPQMENPEYTPRGAKWRPGFLDYAYTALTCATAFSPTDAMPLTQTAKALMGVQATAAIVTIGLVVARAVNILG
jgi:hypothetical protein